MLGGLSDRIRYGWRALSFGCVIHELYFENMRDKNGGWPIIKCSGEVSTCASGERPSKTERVRIQDGETHIFIPYLTHAGGAEVARWGHEWSGGSGQISYLTRDEKKKWVTSNDHTQQAKRTHRTRWRDIGERESGYNEDVRVSIRISLDDRIGQG